MNPTAEMPSPVLLAIFVYVMSSMTTPILWGSAIILAIAFSAIDINLKLWFKS